MAAVVALEVQLLDALRSPLLVDRHRLVEEIVDAEQKTGPHQGPERPPWPSGCHVHEAQDPVKADERPHMPAKGADHPPPDGRGNSLRGTVRGGGPGLIQPGRAHGTVAVTSLAQVCLGPAWLARRERSAGCASCSAATATR